MATSQWVWMPDNLEFWKKFLTEPIFVEHRVKVGDKVVVDYLVTGHEPITPEELAAYVLLKDQ